MGSWIVDLSGAQLSGAQLSVFLRWTIGPRTVGPGAQLSGAQLSKIVKNIGYMMSTLGGVFGFMDSRSVWGPTVRGPAVRFLEVDNWAPDSWAPGPTVRGPTVRGPTVRGPIHRGPICLEPIHVPVSSVNPVSSVRTVSPTSTILQLLELAFLENQEYDLSSGNILPIAMVCYFTLPQTLVS